MVHSILRRYVRLVEAGLVCRCGDLTGRWARHRAVIKIISTVRIVGAAVGRIGHLINHVRGTGIITHHEEDVARAAGVLTDETSKIDPRHGVTTQSRYIPMRRFGPVATIDQARCLARIDQACGLSLRCDASSEWYPG